MFQSLFCLCIAFACSASRQYATRATTLVAVKVYSWHTSMQSPHVDVFVEVASATDFTGLLPVLLISLHIISCSWCDDCIGGTLQ